MESVHVAYQQVLIDSRTTAIFSICLSQAHARHGPAKVGRRMRRGTLRVGVRASGEDDVRQREELRTREQR